jgi:hypothetical protein
MLSSCLPLREWLFYAAWLMAAAFMVCVLHAP